VWEADDRTMRVRAGVGWRAGVVGRLVVDTGVEAEAADAWRGGDPVVFDRIDREPRMANVSLLRSHDIESGLSVVVVPRGRPFGVLAAYADKRRVFQPAEVEFVRAAAKILAIALGREYGERALFEEMQMSTVLAHVGRELMSCADVPVLLVRICELTAQALHCDHSVTWLLPEDEDGFRPVANDGLPAVQWETLGSVVLPSDAVSTLLEDLAQRETVRIAVPCERHPLLSALLERSGIRRAIFAALYKGDTAIGLQMSGHRDRGSEFSLQDERVAHGIAQLASMALLKARVVEELERASQLKSEFVSTMSHELRTPLNIIIGYTDMLRDAVTPEEQASLLGLVRKASHELLEMIDATLNINRFAAGGDVARFAPVALADLWREMQADFEALTPRSEAVLRWEGVEGLEIHTDRRKLKIVLKNLVGNALKFTPTGEIVASYEQVGDQCRFTVRDTGIGIPPEALPHVFDMFRQVDSSDTRSYSGAGLGLYIVTSLLGQLGGRVQVESVVGQGSIFTVVVPVGPPVASAEPEPASVSIPLAEPPRVETPVVAVQPPAAADECPLHTRRRLLFADDLPLNRFLVRRFIAREFPEVEVIEASDGEQAVALFETHRPHLVLMDLHMPNLDGWQAASKLRRRPEGREIPILALSVDASPQAETNAMRAGFKEFIAKPISDYSALKARLTFWLGPRDARDRQALPHVPSPTCDACRREATGKKATAAA
jgi:signal transduction histidine kinase/ActR/RegA family two-component response regulator